MLISMLKKDRHDNVRLQKGSSLPTRLRDRDYPAPIISGPDQVIYLITALFPNPWTGRRSVPEQSMIYYETLDKFS